MSKTVALVYGWAEGPWEAKKFINELNLHEFQLSKDVHTADILVAHSLGCYLIPPECVAKTIVLNGTPLWPHRTYLGSLTRKLKREFYYHKNSDDLKWWFSKFIHNIYYTISRPIVSWHAITKNQIENIPSNAKVLIVHNQNDSFSETSAMKTLAKENSYKFIGFGGLHDDIWTNPKPYVDLLKRL